MAVVTNAVSAGMGLIRLEYSFGDGNQTVTLDKDAAKAHAWAIMEVVQQVEQEQASAGLA